MRNHSIVLLIGHRGVGKTSLLSRIKSYCVKHQMNADSIDLDAYIEQQEGKDITNIFEDHGEKYFRFLEKKYLKQIVQAAKQKIYISLGAGFMGPYPEDAQIIFIKRETDKNGRAFLDRPRLNGEVSAMAEYQELYQKREQHYAGQSDLTLVLQEGLQTNSFYEEMFFGFIKSKNIPGVYTLLPYELSQVNFYLNMNIDKIEIRTDYFDENDLEYLIKIIPEDKLLLSIRDNKNISFTKYMDWPLELGEPESNYYIVSSHTKTKGIAESISQLELYSERCELLKLAISVENFAELQEGHDWHLKNPSKNCFLPISDDGRFSWYRLIQKNKIQPNFFKTTEEGSALDQPYFYEWANSDFNFTGGFAAILGRPVNHSWTPNKHEQFFKKYKMPVVKINLTEAELTQENFKFLEFLGLKAAAVTSPLKNKINKALTISASEPTNTIVKTESGWNITNTDTYGFMALAESIQDKKNIVLWGGGGVIPSVKKVLPQISSYSARAALPREGELAIEKSEVLVWAIGRSQHKNWPDPNWRPNVIIDLNYSEDSPGKEYAQMVGAKYISGAVMFSAQAKKQQEFWSKHLA